MYLLLTAVQGPDYKEFIKPYEFCNHYLIKLYARSKLSSIFERSQFSIRSFRIHYSLLFQKKKIIEVSAKLKFEQSSDERVQSKHTNTENLLKPISAAVLVGMS